MKKDSTAIAIVLDRSGSMSSCRDETIEGFNTTLKEQQALPGEASLTLVTFNNLVEFVNTLTPVAQIEPLSHATYRPVDGTALLDAIGDTIEHVGKALSNMREEDRPERVIVIVMTDGHENASRRFKKARIAEMIQHQREKYAWEFVFMGSEFEAVEEARALGINLASAYEASGAGTSQAHGVMRKGLQNYRKGGNYTP